MIDDRLGEGGRFIRRGTGWGRDNKATMMSTRSVSAASRAPCAARRCASTRASAGRARTATRAGGEGEETPFTNADAFSALSGLKKTGADPFASGAARDPGGGTRGRVRQVGRRRDQVAVDSRLRTPY